MQLPNVSVATANDGRPTYPNNENDGDSEICSFTDQCYVEDDLYSPPGEKVWAVSVMCFSHRLHPENVLDAGVQLSFDDGPTDVSPALYDYLAQNNISSSATHFMIGGNIITSYVSICSMYLQVL